MPRYNALVITRDIHAYVSRDWEAVRENKDAYWGERVLRLGPAEGFRVAEELRRQALQQDPTWLDAASRDEDLQCHVRLAEIFHRAGRAD